MVTSVRFTPFGEGEAEKLVEAILAQRAGGKSVRTIVRELAHGDDKLALRYQNKFRSIVFHQRARTERLMQRLQEEELPFYHPYERRIVTRETPLCRPADLERAVAVLEGALGRSRTAALLDALAQVIVSSSVTSVTSELPVLRQFVERLPSASVVNAPTSSNGYTI